MKRTFSIRSFRLRKRSPRAEFFSMNFRESVEYLYALGNEVLAMKLGLENISKLLAALGNPEKKYLKVQVAGTNGKGSTCAFLESICLRAGIKTGVTTSPHLISITERVRLDGKEISEKDFARHATRVREVSEKLVADGELETVPTYFEQVTAIALNAFAEAEVELAILETGLGGRFDATTAAHAEIVSVTPVDYDHQQILGESLAEIAAEKAAIIRADTRVVLSEQKDEAMNVILEKCELENVKPRFANYRTEIKAVDAVNGRVVSTFAGDELYENVRLGLSGRHQLTNARTAISLAEILRKDFGFKIGKTEIVEGLENARHKGRLEFYENFLFDGAHNISGAKALREFLDEFVCQPITLVFGAMRDKDLTEIAEILFPKADFIIFTKPDNPRSMDASDLENFLPPDFGNDKVLQTQTVKEALEKAREVSSENHLIVVTGSLYLVGEAQKILNE